MDEAKQFLSDAIIADVNSDTVEVVYNIKKVFDLMSDVEQIGETLLRSGCQGPQCVSYEKLAAQAEVAAPITRSGLEPHGQWTA